MSPKGFFALVLLLGAPLFLLGCAAIAATPLLKHSMELDAKACKGTLSYSAELKTGDGRAIKDEPLEIYAGGKLLDVIRTDPEGKIKSSLALLPEWCGKKITFEIIYPGSAFYREIVGRESITVRMPSKITIFYPKNATAGEELSIKARLVDGKTGAPLAGRQISLYGKTSAKQVTGAGGETDFILVYPNPGMETFSIAFEGDEIYESSLAANESIGIAQAGCRDGTLAKACSAVSIGQYCSEEKELGENCGICGCPLGLYCAGKSCVTAEDRTKLLINNIEKSVVLVKNDQVSGSGVIFDYNGETIVVTNRHVVDPDKDLGGVTGLFVKTYDGKIYYPKGTYISPNAMDLAVLTFTDSFGQGAELDAQYTPTTGDDVLILGSPLGLQHSVSKGIISNYPIVFNNDASTYIQTDAAVNHGNSGGGMFLIKSGKLIGINTQGIIDKSTGTIAPGLNFAIHLRELNFSKGIWLTFKPVPRCIDGTRAGACSNTNKGYLCSAVSLSPIAKCSSCGCAAKAGSDPYCIKESEQCEYCPSGYSAYKTTAGNFYCCKPGTVLSCNQDGGCICQ